MSAVQEKIESDSPFDLQAAATLERRASLSMSAFEQQFSVPHKPVILTDMVDDWPARKWTPEVFASKWGEKTFHIDGNDYCLREFVKLVMQSSNEAPAPYLRNINIGAEFPELLPDLKPIPKYCKHNRLETRLFPQRVLKRGEGRYIQLFIGGTGRAFPRLHWDSPPFHTWSTLLCGRKEWILFPPEDTRFLYPQSKGADVSQISNVYNIDLNVFPNIAHTHPIRVIQEPGECLFVPANWWHTARNLKPSITVAWDQLCRSSWGDYSNYMLGIRRDNIFKYGAYTAYFAVVGGSLTLFEKMGLGNV